MRINRCFIALLLLGSVKTSFAQFQIDGQFLIRAEMRNGYNALIPEGKKPAIFTAQRARLQAGYQFEKVKLYVSIQDVRTWGNTPQIKTSDNNLSVHEAFVDFQFAPKWSVKLGRQELNYDNFRFLGNLDWALQGRAHDVALLKYENEEKGSKLHIGGAYNQSGQYLTDSVYTVANQYKAAQFIRYEQKINDFQFSLLAWNDGREFTQYNGAQLADKGIRYRLTLGAPIIKLTKKQATYSAFYYQQLGKDPKGKTVNAFNANVQVAYKFKSKKPTAFTTAALGAEWLSGTATNELQKNNAYTPAYGTNHIFNGYMDLFYVGGAHENSVGLQDVYTRVRRTFSAKFFAQANGHFFSAMKPVLFATTSNQKRLGGELDFSLGWEVHKAFCVQAGYSQFFHTDTMDQLKGNLNFKDNQNWAYVMLIVRPTMKQKFVGILL